MNDPIPLCHILSTQFLNAPFLDKRKLTRQEEKEREEEEDIRKASHADSLDQTKIQLEQEKQVGYLLKQCRVIAQSYEYQVWYTLWNYRFWSFKFSDTKLESKFLKLIIMIFHVKKLKNQCELDVRVIACNFQVFGILLPFSSQTRLFLNRKQKRYIYGCFFYSFCATDLNLGIENNGRMK